jgi:hypothetical protein
LTRLSGLKYISQRESISFSTGREAFHEKIFLSRLFGDTRWDFHPWAKLGST